MRTLLTLLLLAPFCGAEPKIELGAINGAQFRIDMPDNWNRGLVVYCHGYSAAPGKFNSNPNPLIDMFLSRGYAVAQSGYAAGGWAIEEAIQDTQALRRYFVQRYGAPAETYVTGHSMGGFLTMTLLESFPNDYDAGLALCGPLAPASYFMSQRVFDMRVVFDYYFPGALPPPDKLPADYAMSLERTAGILTLLASKPREAEVFRRYAGLKTDKDAAGTIVFFTYILKDLQQRSGGNPFDNRSTIYTGTPDDNALNDGVKRYASNPRAAEYVRTWYTPTGRLARPLLAIHTTYDALVPPSTPNTYIVMTQQAGAADLFVQQYVKHDGHCSIAPQEIEKGFTQLREWKASGVRPR